MRPSMVVDVFRRFEREAGIVGVAYGTKEVAGKTEGNPSSLAFFVREKLPLRGQRRALSDGRRLLPKRIELNGEHVPTDVVVTTAPLTEQPAAPGAGLLRTGSRVSNGSIAGTFGALARLQSREGLYALTNQHIGLSPRTSTYFPDAMIPGSVVGTTHDSVGLVADEAYLGVIDRPGTYIDVDAALIAIPPMQEARFSADTPGIGRLSGVFEPDRASFDSFTESLLNRNVFAYSWKTGRRTGRISHVYFALRRTPDHTDSVASFVVQSTDGFVPGEHGDSGKMWMTAAGDRTLAVGLHSGVVTVAATGARFAIAAEMSSLSRYLGLALVT